MLGINIRNIRKSKNISINKLSKMTGISLGYLSDIENNKAKNPTMEKLQKISSALGVSVNEFFNNINNESIEELKEIKAIETKSEKRKQIDTIAAHLEEKNLTPKKVKLLESYIDALFDEI